MNPVLITLAPAGLANLCVFHAVIRHGRGDRDQGHWDILLAGLSGIVTGYGFWHLHLYVTSAVWGACGGFLLALWWRGSKPRRDRARKLIGDKARLLIAGLVRNMEPVPVRTQ